MPKISSDLSGPEEVAGADGAAAYYYGAATGAAFGAGAVLPLA